MENFPAKKETGIICHAIRLHPLFVAAAWLAWQGEQEYICTSDLEKIMIND
jgi:hypothetical protein